MKKYSYILIFDELNNRVFEQISNFVEYLNGNEGSLGRLALLCQKCNEDINRHLTVIGREFPSKALNFLGQFVAARKTDNLSQVVAESGIIVDKLNKKFKDEDIQNTYNRFTQSQRKWANGLKHKSGDITIILNGRVERLSEDEALLDSKEISSLSLFESKSRIDNLAVNLEKSSFVEIDLDDQTSEMRSDVLMQICSMVGREEIVHKITRHNLFSVEHSFQINAKNNSPEFTLFGLLNPLSDSAQKFSTIFLHLMNYFNVEWKITLNPHESYDDIPLKEFYRFVFVPELKFDEKGDIETGSLTAKFENLPEDSLFTMNLESSDAMMIMAKTAKYDLDNIMLKNIAENHLDAVYELRHIMVEGNCHEISSGSAPNGLQLSLKSSFDGVEEKQGTVVMQNHGYFQLRSNPGIWYLDLAEGKSSEIYRFADTKLHNVYLDSFNGKWIKLDVDINEGKENLKLFEEKKKKETGFWSKFNIWGSDKASSAPSSSNDTLHIFSVASGHLYERFLSVMMLSVVNHTQSNVKFWIIENFISPDFKVNLFFLFSSFF